MIRIKAVDEQNILDVCELTPRQGDACAAMAGHTCCNAMAIAEATYDPEMHPNAIYHNNLLIGFFMYRRAENQADTATICRFMIAYPFQHKGLGKQALQHVLRGLKIQGVRRVLFLIHDTNHIAEKLCCSLGFRSTGKREDGQSCYGLEL